jgi:hypothetical protein
MFDHACTSCERRQLIFPGQVTALTNTDHGIELSFVCWCGAEQTTLIGRAATERLEVAPAA